MAKVKSLTFTDDATGRQAFQFLSDGVYLGSLQLRAAIPREEALRVAKARTRLEASIQRVLLSISAPAIDPPAWRPQDCARDLLTGPQTITLTGEQLEHIDKLLTSIAWGGAQQIAIADLYDFLSLAPEVEAPS